jgi:hypothetical protein
VRLRHAGSHAGSGACDCQPAQQPAYSRRD